MKSSPRPPSGSTRLWSRQPPRPRRYPRLPCDAVALGKQLENTFWNKDVFGDGKQTEIGLEATVTLRSACVYSAWRAGPGA